ncbi:hypothetical protein [Hydrogenophaga sp. BPS33]|uniref:hypothetical protein n=1 Tax=Hydrogenophaga sp. BPS33 TaxID=2651974 RepID=UPI00131F8FD6|nr:hypothetical protein [Hydrogenophaga sp. BPS33]QHE86736.1 hypothetical protein F9K07_18445 [Hydrogenophaga sp. BPS33]
MKSLAANGEPFRAKLILDLPRDWRPSNPLALQAAFTQIEVDELVVVTTTTPTAPGTGDRGGWPAPRSRYTQEEEGPSG